MFRYAVVDSIPHSFPPPPNEGRGNREERRSGERKVKEVGEREKKTIIYDQVMIVKGHECQGR